MTKRMLIDANHPEETRVVVLQDHQLADFDFESSTKRQIKGNVYLAKVTRVEPSLQAAFVDYGGNRHGFLAFSEIHPDYFQIPQADRELLAKLERESAEAEGANGDGNGSAKRKPARRRAAAADIDTDADGGGAGAGETADGEDDDILQVREDAEEETAEVMSEQARRRAKLLRSYKIQEVIKRRQIMLVQVVKEERGTKGAALTTYLSLAGRYCVLMPNTARGGGISRKISSGEDRAKLKSIMAELEVPQGMGLIVRTAGQQRSRTEIKRDYDYLMRQWSEIRDTTLKSVAPALIYAEGDLVKRAMRDLYSRDIDEVLVEGEAAHRAAKRLMTMMMPSRARHVKLYKDDLPLFFKYKVEDQLDAMHSPTVQLPSGGSIVMHATEALIAIDVNSGKSTRERHIDETAVKTNLEAADEIARQLRLRDLAGLVVIDFIDMAENRHQRSVEKRMRDALKIDRARIQLGRISMFGLLELSRQRLRPSLQELSSQVCPTCNGLGSVRSTESCALQALRLAEEAGIRGDAKVTRLLLPTEVALYVLNQKRDGLVRLEQRYAMRIEVAVDRDSTPGQVKAETLEARDPAEVAARLAAAEAPAEAAPVAAPGAAVETDEAVAEAAAAGPGAAAEPRAEAHEGEDDEAGRKRRRRRRRRRRSDEVPAAETPAAEPVAASSAEPVAESTAAEATAAESTAAESTAEAPAEAAVAVDATPGETCPDAVSVPAETAAVELADEPAPELADAPKKPRRRRRPRKPATVEASAPAATPSEGEPADTSPLADEMAPAEALAAEAQAAEAVPAASTNPETAGRHMAGVPDAAADVPGPGVEAFAAEPDPEQLGEASLEGASGNGALSNETVSAAADATDDLHPAEPDPAGPDPAEPNAAEPNAAEIGPAATGSTEAQPADTETGPTETGPTETGPTETGPTDRGPAAEPREMALAEEGEEQPPARQGWWSRWVR